MMGLPLAFAQPLILLGLLSLPVLWWLLRLIPPRPRRQMLGSEKLLLDILPKEETPSRTPWWLMLLRLLLAALLIIAAAGPLWNPPVATSSGSAPIMLLIDDGWASASTWDARIRTAEDIIARAETNNNGVALVPLSEPNRDISLDTPASALVRVQQMQPKPHTIERSDALPAIGRFLSTTQAQVVWLSNGTDLGTTPKFVEGLARLLDGRSMTVVEGGLAPARALAASDNAAGALTVKVLRPNADDTNNGIVRALDLKGLPLGETTFAFNAGARETNADINLPVEIRNDIARLEITGEHSAGAVQLLDKRWRRRTVGVISGATADTAQPLLAATFYLSRALNPFADVRVAERGSPSEATKQLIEQGLSVLILADVGNIASDSLQRLTRWIEEDGGVLIRFAGPRLAAADDGLVPVKLRRGGRTLGGSLTWDKPQPLTGFSDGGPFADMTVPDDVTVTRQVLAEPEVGLPERTWATLADGTPLVTAARRGKGMIVLFHVTSDTRWSNLPISGAYVDMLKRIVALSGTAVAPEQTANANRDRQEVVPPTRVLDGFGAFSPPPATARPVPTGFAGRATLDHPPGFYGPPEGLLAVNTLEAADRLSQIDFSPLNAIREVYRVAEPRDLRGPIFSIAFGMLVLDALIVLMLSGGLRRLLPRRRVAAVLLAGVLMSATSIGGDRAHAQTTNDATAIAATLQTRLAYVLTGDSEVDRISKAGLQGLTLFLAQRTALEAGEPMGVDVGRDELSFFPLIYWPISPGAPRPSAEALARVDSYMKQGGTVLFDTRDAIEAPPGPGGETRGPGMQSLRQILSSLDLPELEPVPRDHVLTKTFFLLRDFPGRFSTGRLWVEALPAQDADERQRPARGGDGVSSILITSNDLAGAWALGPENEPMLPMVPGEPRQREFAYRAGVNIVMYTLTGNYKADQVHVPALLERLGQ